MHPDPADAAPADRTSAEAPGVAELAALCVELAEGAAEVVRQHTGERGLATAKSTATDLVTVVDRRVEQWLRSHLSHRRPADAVLGEEEGGQAGTSQVRWLLDPIDGTVNFVLGLPQYAVSVAAEADGTVVAGAVCNPVSRETFRAALGDGAYLGTRRLTGPRDVPLARAVIGTGFGYDAGLRSRQVAVIAGLLPQVADIRRLGAASLDLCAVAAGRLDAYFEAGLNPWDYAAGALIAAEAGCVVSGLGGRAPSSVMTAVAGPSTATDLFGLLTELRADQVFDSPG